MILCRFWHLWHIPTIQALQQFVAKSQRSSKGKDGICIQGLWTNPAPVGNWFKHVYQKPLYFMGCTNHIKCFAYQKLTINFINQLHGLTIKKQPAEHFKTPRSFFFSKASLNDAVHTFPLRCGDWMVIDLGANGARREDSTCRHGMTLWGLESTHLKIYYPKRKRVFQPIIFQRLC